MNIISKQDLKAMMDRGEKFYLVEALAPEAYQRAHLPGAINIPWDQAAQLAPQLLPEKNRPVITYCSKFT